MSDGYLNLYKAGKITNDKKPLHRGKGVFSICMGSQELYDFLDHNQDILSAPMYYVNNPETIRQLDDFISINSCIAVDLYGQVCSESAGTRHISGTGGQLDFVTGATLLNTAKLLSHAVQPRRPQRKTPFQHPAEIYGRRHHHDAADPGAIHRHRIRCGQPVRSCHLAAGRSLD